MTNWRRFTIGILAFLLLGYGALLLVLFVAQRNLVFPGSHNVYRTPAELSHAYEDVMLPVKDGLTNAWYMPVPNPKGAILFSHGNGGNIAGWCQVAEPFLQLGLSVLVYDYGGYGRSTGQASEKRCYEDVRAAWNYLTAQKHFGPEKIVLAGRSIGGGPTLQLATEVKPAAVILESTFLSLPQAAQHAMPLIPVSLLMRDRFENGQKIAGVQAPVLIIHSLEDNLIPIAQARRLFELANQPKTFVQIHGGHNNGYSVSRDQYQTALVEFLTPLFDGGPK